MHEMIIHVLDQHADLLLKTIKEEEKQHAAIVSLLSALKSILNKHINCLLRILVVLLVACNKLIESYFDGM